MEEQNPPKPMTYTVKFWFSGLEESVEFQTIEADFERFKSYLSDTEPKEFFEFDTPGHTVVLANMIEVDAVKLVSLPKLDASMIWEEEPSEVTIQLIGRSEPFSASTSEEHLGPDHPVRQLLDTDSEKFIHWLDARGNTVVMNPKKLSYVEHPKYWIEGLEDWADDDGDGEDQDDTSADEAEAEVDDSEDQDDSDADEVEDEEDDSDDEDSDDESEDEDQEEDESAKDSD
jgi:hypothetical protein